MFTNISMTGTGLLITLIETALRLAGVEFEEGSVVAAVNGVAAAIGLALLVLAQLTRKDLKVGLVRKTPKKK